MRKINVLFVSIFLFAIPGYAPVFAAPDFSLDGVMNEWNTGSGLTETETSEVQFPSGGSKNPVPKSRGNFHNEFGKSYGLLDDDSDYDAERLGLYIDNNLLYIALQTDYDFTTDVQTMPPGDFLFQFRPDKIDTTKPTASYNGTTMSADSALYNEINGNTELALDFSFNGDTIDNLQIHYGDLGFDYASDVQNAYSDETDGLAYRVAKLESGLIQAAYTFDIDFSANSGNKAIYNQSGGTEYDGSEYNRHTLELVIDLSTIVDDTSQKDEEIQKLFADTNYVQMHWQMACGNDVLYAGTSTGADPVPEPGTMVLLGFGLIGLAGITRKKVA